MEEQPTSEFPQFRTKSGYCTITPDQIVLSRSGLFGEIAQLLTERSITKILIIYSIAALFMFTAAWQSWVFQMKFLSVLFILLGIRLALGVVTSMNNTAIPAIDLNTIEKVKWNPGIPLIAKPHFKVVYKDNKGKLKNRLIILPGGITGDPKEKLAAVQVMKDAGLIS